MYHGWFRLCLFADGSTATAGEKRTPAPGHLPFWFKPVSAFGLLELTAFISSSPELAMPSTLAPDRFGASSRRVLSRETRPPGSGEVTLSQELRTVGLLRPHVLVGYQWSHTGLCPGCRPVITTTSAASCRTSSISLAAGNWLLTAILPSHAPHPTPVPAGSGRAQTLLHWLLSDTDRQLSKTERGPISTNCPSILSISPNQAIPAEKSIRCSLLAAVGPLTILSWPEALNASRSKRAPEAIRRNACSLLALPDFLEFAQAVRYGVPGTPPHDGALVIDVGGRSFHGSLVST